MGNIIIIAARQFAAWDIGRATILMPRFSVIYVKRTDKTPKTTTITFTFPDGQGIQQGMQQGQAKMIIEIGLEDGLDESAILKRMQEKIGFSME